MMKMKKLILNASLMAGLTVASLGVLLNATAQDAKNRNNGGSKSFAVGTFSALKASRGVTVNISIGADQSINATGPKGKMDHLEVFVKDETLFVRRGKGKRSWGWNDYQNYNVTVVTPTLNAIDVSSGADVNATNINSPNMALDSSSGADIYVSGQCGTLTADASSGADIDASKLLCKSAVADVSSGADIDVYADTSFTGEASSGGDITVLGSPPKSESSTSSGGDITVR